MSESVQFWLDNKMSAGVKVAAIGDQLLVVYREKFYVVEKGAAQMKGGRPLHYSKTSLPLLWKKALRGDAPPPEAVAAEADDALPLPSVTKRVRTQKKKPQPAGPAPVSAQETDQPAEPVQSPLQTQVAPQAASEAKKPRFAKAAAVKPSPQAVLLANCPYCHHKHELPLEKGKNGKPFFVACAKCKADFAVRFVPVTIYQAQVAGFH